MITKKFKLNVAVTEMVNPDLIGGFKLRIEDQQIDASISSKLRAIKNELINK
jgi:F-type H+-transporting ATPase subunit delta